MYLEEKYKHFNMEHSTRFCEESSQFREHVPIDLNRASKYLNNVPIQAQIH